MKHIFRNPLPGPGDFAALCIFGVIYLAVLGLIIAPDAVTALMGAP